MSLHFEQELDELKEKLLTMATSAESLVTMAVKSLTERDDTLATRVKENDDVLDRLEMEIDDLSVHLLSKAPLASDLRFITVAMKISRDLERVGDEATTVSRRARELNREPQLKPYVDLPKMGDLAVKMLHQAMDSFINKTPDRAREVIPRDKEVDALNKQLYRELTSFMIESPAAITRCLHLIIIAKSLERIADHATNIAEEVVYLCEALDIRHDPKIKGRNVPRI